MDDTHGRAVIEVIHCLKDVGTRTFGDIFEEISNGILGIVSDVVHVLLHSLQTVVIHN